MADDLPIGAILAYPRDLQADSLPEPVSRCWLLCDGAEFRVDDEKYMALHSAIGFLYGGNEQHTKFRIPDYRGRFLRGVDAGSGHDPDVAIRGGHRTETPALYQRPEGAVGDEVGSIQGDATGRPAKAFSSSVAHLPNDVKATAHTTSSPPETAKYDSGARRIDTCNGGGDAETRPLNLYVHFLIKYRDQS